MDFYHIEWMCTNMPNTPFMFKQHVKVNFASNDLLKIRNQRLLRVLQFHTIKRNPACCKSQCDKCPPVCIQKSTEVIIQSAGKVNSRVEPDTRLKRVSGTDKALLPSTSIIRVIRVNICARIEYKFSLGS